MHSVFRIHVLLSRFARSGQTMPPTKKVVLLLCGSFNPITIMHLRMFETARDHLLLDHGAEVIRAFISPVSDSYESKKNLQTSKHRCEMIRLSLKPLQGLKHWVELSDWECLQPNWSCTLDVLQHHQRIMNTEHGHGQVQVKFLCGADLLESFNTNVWSEEHIESIVQDFGVIVITREGNDPWLTLNQSVRSRILTKHKNNIHIVEEKFKNNISSTLIRDCVVAKLSIRYLVDDDVSEYIKKHKLYALTS